MRVYLPTLLIEVTDFACSMCCYPAERGGMLIVCCSGRTRGEELVVVKCVDSNVVRWSLQWSVLLDLHLIVTALEHDVFTRESHMVLIIRFRKKICRKKKKGYIRNI